MNILSTFNMLVLQYVCIHFQATGQRIGTVLQAIGTVIFSVALALYYQWQVGLISMCSVPLMAIVLYYESKYANTATFGSTKSMEASSKVKCFYIIFY